MSQRTRFASIAQNRWRMLHREIMVLCCESHAKRMVTLCGKTQSSFSFFHILLTVHFGKIFVNNQLDPQLSFMYVYFYSLHVSGSHVPINSRINALNAELNPICYLLALLARHFLHVSRIRVKSLTLRLLMSYIHGAPILDVSRSHTTTQHSR